MFRSRRGIGSRQDKVVLVQARDILDSETGGSYIVKTYSSKKVVAEQTDELIKVKATFSLKKPAFEPIVARPITGRTSRRSRSSECVRLIAQSWPRWPEARENGLVQTERDMIPCG